AVVFHTLTQGFNAAIFPRMARLTGKHGDLSEARRSFFRAVRYQAWWAAPLAAGIFLYSDNIAGWFGAQYRDGIPDLDVGGTTASALRILVIAMLLDAVGGPVGMMVLGTGTLDRFLPVLGGTLAATSVIFNLLWIPRYGILGAAQASLVASGIQGVIKVILVSKLFGNPWPLLLRPLPYFALAVGMGFALAAGPLASSPLLGGLAGAFSYGVVTLALGLVDPAIRKRLARLVRR
ncbi:MAG: polysaccharide biosynthesis C-terminal domain-containing protein, partial [Planctomycetota bacterium]